MSDELDGSRPAEFLLVEDNENDVILTRQGLKRAKLLVNLHTVPDGIECLAFLRKEGRYAGVPTPDLILLDLNLPRMNGAEVMKAICADDALKSLPVVVLTTSEDRADIEAMYGLRVSSYIVKPIDFDQFVHHIRSLCNYWLTVVVLPRRRPSPP